RPSTGPRRNGELPVGMSGTSTSTDVARGIMEPGSESTAATVYLPGFRSTVWITVETTGCPASGTTSRTTSWNTWGPRLAAAASFAAGPVSPAARGWTENETTS